MYYYDKKTNGFLVQGVNLIPEGAINITDEYYQQLLSGQSQGKQIIVDKAGNPILIDQQPSAAHQLNLDTLTWEISAEKQTALLAETQTRLVANIDEHAAKIYSTWTRFESEYRERQAAAEAFKAANYEGECSRYISDFAQRARLDNKTATNLILTQAAGLEKLQVELANQRMRKYELKAPNLTLEQLQSIYDDIIKQMDNLMEAYQNG
ncbi:TPA: hypothetical protein ACPO8V_000010 [Haemophilus influenzae]|uniref:hypothetical protein n=1 Tax=Haemophilus influenzae TaxID=727 RepID=UPI000D005350|nr:hypothetical protein [Haemophilus influenzae]MCK8813586.1 hypothetical protein [Haemophilus influenzae]MCK8850257.1 hypothetical protein [Haemophilus influenzae]MCK8893820.1 hypothetical protein [Haemophilus influenzae]PRJ17213.1 hypothetical protein BV050_00491 [Haemophilus influenzae]PRL69682.1 hypothetical protein BV049_00698 [Haemophilus influenzae]